MRVGLLRRRALLRGLLVGGAVAAAGALTPAPVLGQRTAGAKAVARRRTVVLDPGHGGIDPGAIGLSGVYEKDLALDASRLVAQLLEATKRYRVVLTRTSDEFVPLQDRVARARAVDGDLFLSIHADALPDPEMRGASVFTLSEKASDAQAAALAARENKADLIAGIDLSHHAPEVSSILIDLARRQTNNQSIRLARRHARSPASARAAPTCAKIEPLRSLQVITPGLRTGWEAVKAARDLAGCTGSDVRVRRGRDGIRIRLRRYRIRGRCRRYRVRGRRRRVRVGGRRRRPRIRGRLRQWVGHRGRRVRVGPWPGVERIRHRRRRGRRRAGRGSRPGRRRHAGLQRRRHRIHRLRHGLTSQRSAYPLHQPP